MGSGGQEMRMGTKRNSGALARGNSSFLGSQRDPASGIRHPGSGIQHPASSIQHPASSIRHPASTAPEGRIIHLDLFFLFDRNSANSFGNAKAKNRSK